MKFVLDANALQIISLFENLTGAGVKDFVPGEEQVIFVVSEGEIGRAVGKGGQHVRNLEGKLKKRVKIVEFNADLLQFVKNLVLPAELKEAKVEGDVIFLSAKDLKTRGLLIGRGASNLRLFETIVQRYFPIKEIKVV